MSDELNPKPKPTPRRRRRRRKRKMTVANREVVTLSDRPGAFAIIKRGPKNTRVAPTKDLKSSFVVENSLLTPPGNNTVGIPDESVETDEEFGDSFEMLAELTCVVAKKFANGIFITGPGGTGKTLS